MPNLHIRDVPEGTVHALRAAAERKGRSLNAELVAALVSQGDREQQRADVVRELDRIRRGWRRRNPDGLPPGLEPETILRALRDAD